jgi:hypothetical protein
MHFNASIAHFGEFMISQEDYSKLRNDQAFSKMLSAIAFENSAVQDRGQKAARGIISLLNSIEQELSEKID